MRDSRVMVRLRRLATYALCAAGIIALVSAAAYLVAGRPRPGRVAPNVVIAGQDVGGMRAAQGGSVIDRASRRWPATAVRVRVGQHRLSTSAERLGIALDGARTLAAVERIGREGAAPRRALDWMISLVRPRVADLHFAVDDGAMRATLLRSDPGPTRAPREPSFRLGDGAPRIVAGRPGLGARPADVLESVRGRAARWSGGPVEIGVGRGQVPPRFTEADARALAGEAVALTASGLSVRIGDGPAIAVPAAAVRPWLAARTGPDRLEVAVDPDAAAAGLRDLVTGAGTPPVDAGFTVTGDGVAITPSRPGTECCDAEALAPAVLASLRGKAPMQLPLRPAPPRRSDDDAARLGVRDVVGTFTTAHKCCEARVQNIHRIADLLRGHVIEPGATFSVNQVVGRRTADKGFVSAPVIENGQMAADIGGGVSQFATTLFNAAWFAGLGFGEYQSHSLYISRYPYGREATMGYPNPDLEIKNTSPYGILMWPSYTGTTITVTLYSTKQYSSVTVSNQARTAQGTCTVVTTERTRVGLDGQTKVDTTTARYRAEAGLNCDGTRAPPPAG